MKKFILCPMLLTLVLSVASSCKDTISKVDQYVPFDIDDVDLKPQQQDTTASTGSGICSIYELNHSDMGVNSHSNVWQSSTLEMDWSSYKELKPGTLEVNYPIYPRIKKMANGKYLLLYENTTGAEDCYYAISEDLKSWKNMGYLFQREGSLKYKNPDAVVLRNGDIIAVACKQNKYITAKRSTDNAQTWSSEQILHTGEGMEPSIIELSSGEIQVYYTKCQTVRGYSHGYGDSGTGIIRSTDGGNTWTEDEGKIIRQYTGVWPLSYEYEGNSYNGDGQPIYTDQMAVGIELNEDRGIAVAFESRFISTYYLGMAYNSDNWTEERSSDPMASYPSKRVNSWTLGAGPYLRQFPSGETLLSFRKDKKFQGCIGNSIAREFDNSPIFDLFSKAGGGCWGSIELDDSHVMIGTYPFGYSAESGDRVSDVLIGRFILNHQIYATGMIPTLDGSHDDWSDVQEALFIGSESAVQTSLRFAYSSDYVYVLVERLDESVDVTDVTTLSFISSEATGSPFDIVLSPDGKGGIKVDQKGVTVSGIVNAKASENMRAGYLAEISIPRGLLNLSGNSFLFDAVATDTVYGVNDTFDGVSASDCSSWMPVMLTKYTKPDPEPEPKETDRSGDGPSWNYGETEVNPW